MRIIVAVLSVLIGPLSLTTAQTELPTKEELAEKIPILKDIPGFNTFNVSSVNFGEIQNQLEDKCKKYGGPTAFETAKDAPKFFQDCMSSLVDLTVLQQEMEEAKPKGELDTVFNKYCNKVPSLKKCVQNVTDTFSPCLKSEEKVTMKIVHNVTDSLLEFVCHNEGDRIAMFIAAGGTECINGKQPEIQACAEKTFGKYQPAIQNATSHLTTLQNTSSYVNSLENATSYITSLPLLVIKLEQCLDMENFKDCVVPVLETCADPTPGNVVDSLFTYVKKNTPCELLLTGHAAANTRSDTGNGSATTSVVNLLLMTFAMVISLRFV